MQPSQGNSKQTLLFAPFVINTWEGKSNGGFCYNITSFNEKNNMIITCPSHNSIQFYDATTLSHFEEMETEPLDSSVRDMTFCPETETYLFRTLDGNIYAYDLPNKTLKNVQKNVNPFVPKVVFIHSGTYAFSVDSNLLCIGNLRNENCVTFTSGKNRRFICSLESLTKRKLLLVGLDCGSVILYRTDRLPKLPVLGLIRGCEKSAALEVKSLIINGKEYILAAGCDNKIRIWHIIKGRMRLLKAIQMKETVSSMVYLEDYKMLAMAHNMNYLRFLQLPCGKLEARVDVELESCTNVFLLKGKNALEVASMAGDIINIVQLHPYW